MTTPTYVNSSELSHQLGVTRSTVSMWRGRHADTPQPVAYVRSRGQDNPLWGIDQVEAWKQWRQARDDGRVKLERSLQEIKLGHLEDELAEIKETLRRADMLCPEEDCDSIRSEPGKRCEQHTYMDELGL